MMVATTESEAARRDGRGTGRRGRSALCLLLVLLVALQHASAASWEYAPYDIRVWMAVAPRAELPEPVRREIAETVQRRAEVEFSSTWNLSQSPPPASLAVELALGLERVDAARVLAVEPKALAHDKLLCVRIDANPTEFLIQARELDGSTAHWGPLVERRVHNPHALAASVFSTILAAFAPIARIETGEAQTAVVRLRAGGLALDDDSPVRVGHGDVLVPIIRNNDRYGNLILERTAEIPWTLLQVTGADRNNANLLDCNVYSGMRAPIRGRASSRRERYALRVRAVHPQTEVVLQVRPLKTGEPSLPLAGLEMYSKIPVPEPPRERTPEEALAEEQRNPPEFIGLTDWQGRIAIASTDAPVRLVYVKNGGQLLARLPIVAGYHLRQVAEVPDDNPRLQAEGFIRGMNGQIMDLVAQRQILATRIRRRIAENKLDEAQRLLEQLRALKSRNDIQRELDLQARRQLTSPYLSVQARIDKLYGDTRALLTKFLDPDLPNQLMAEIRQAREGGAGPKAPSADS